MYLRVPALQNLESDWTIMQILKRTVNQGGIPQDSEEEDEEMNTLPVSSCSINQIYSSANASFLTSFMRGLLGGERSKKGTRTKMKMKERYRYVT